MTKGQYQVRIDGMPVGNFTTLGLLAKELMKSTRPISIEIYECVRIVKTKPVFEHVAAFERLQ